MAQAGVVEGLWARIRFQKEMDVQILGRRISVTEIPKKSIELARIIIGIRKFRRPLSVLYHYIKKSPPKCGFVQLRAGQKIYLSSNQHDIITVVVLFCRGEYGTIHKGDVVVDIGANIGSFSVLAASSGAGRIISIEPNTESFTMLEKNVSAPENDYSAIIKPLRRAISSQSGQTLFIPAASSPYNRSSVSYDSNLEAVETVSLSEIVDEVGDIDLLKLDCEGAEHDVIMNSPDEVLARVKEIRMELHPVRGSSKQGIVARLEDSGFRLYHQENMIFWFLRHGSGPS